MVNELLYFTNCKCGKTLYVTKESEIRYKKINRFICHRCEELEE